MLVGLACTAAAAQLLLLSLDWEWFIFSLPSLSPLPPIATCNMISLCPGWQLETQNTLLVAVMVLLGSTGLWSCSVQACELWQNSLSVPLPLLCVCLHRPTSTCSSPCCFQERLSLLAIFPCCLWISPSLACFIEMVWPLLHLTHSFKIPPLVSGSFEFLLVSY